MTDKQSSSFASELPDDVWLIRPCEVYKEEYKDCRSVLSRIYQYYTVGNIQDCSHWLTDFNTCMKFRHSRDSEAAETLIAVEKEKRKQRLQNAKANDIWEYRTTPPPEWMLPLPK